MERCIAMNAKKVWISTTIVLLVSMCCFCKTDVLAAEKNSHQEKLVKVSPKNARSRVARIRRSNTTVYNQLKQTVGLSALTLDTPFSEAIDLLRNSTQPPLRIVVLWRDLSENANVERDTPIRIDGVSGIRLRTGLEILLMAVSGSFAKLGYVVEHGVIIIATKQSLPAKMITRVYDISDLVARPARFGFGFAPGLGGGWPMGAYAGGRGRMALRGGTNWAAGRGGRRRSGRGTATVWGPEQGSRRASRISNVIRDTVRPNTWR